MRQNNKYSQAGNVFVMILAGIFLFGALMFTFTRGASKGANSLSKHEARVAAQEIMNYAQALETAVNRVRRNGCSENEISFENTTVAGYTNANAPSDNSCHIFHDNGGKIQILEASSLQAVDIYYVGRTDMHGVGTFNCGDSSCSELYMVMRFDNAPGKQLCDQINLLLNDSDLYPTLSTTWMFETPPFQGVFGNPLHYTGNGALEEKLTACFNYSPTPTINYFYHVLLAR